MGHHFASAVNWTTRSHPLSEKRKIEGQVLRKIQGQVLKLESKQTSKPVLRLARRARLGIESSSSSQGSPMWSNPGTRLCR
jgi:hypothetical protein